MNEGISVKVTTLELSNQSEATINNTFFTPHEQETQRIDMNNNTTTNKKNKFLNPLTSSSSHKMLFTKINFNKYNETNRKTQKLPLIAKNNLNKLEMSNTIHKCLSPKASMTNIIRNNKLKMTTIIKNYSKTPRKNMYFRKLTNLHYKLHEDIINNIKQQKRKQIEINENDTCIEENEINRYQSKRSNESIISEKEKIQFENEYKKKDIHNDVRTIIINERNKIKRKKSMLSKNSSNTENDQINKRVKPVYLQKLEYAMFIRKNHPMLQINQIGKIPEMFKDGNFMNKLLNDGFSSVLRKFPNIQN